ncbi:MAG TPA: hypothetical protein VKX16_18290, partial [Chloroflexota bacterium]|nr:hypothetical protein [Chloroflexota bacterium]
SAQSRHEGDCTADNKRLVAWYRATGKQLRFDSTGSSGGYSPVKLDAQYLLDRPASPPGIYLLQRSSATNGKWKPLGLSAFGDTGALELQYTCPILLAQQLEESPPAHVSAAPSSPIGGSQTWLLSFDSPLAGASSARYRLYVDRKLWHPLRLAISASLSASLGIDIQATLTYSRFNQKVTIAVPAMPVTGGHAYAVSSLLPDGQVLVAGGMNSWGFIGNAARYDPSRGTWSRVGDMRRALGVPMNAALLGNRGVLVTGTSFPTAPAPERYDLSTHSWNVIAIPAHERLGDTVTVLKDGRVLVLGGVSDGMLGPFGDGPTSLARLYDPRSGSWTIAADLPTPIYGSVTTLLPDGRVLVVGGSLSNVLTAELYDPADDRWSPAAAPAWTVPLLAMWHLADGRVLALSYFAGDSAIYDPGTGAWADYHHLPVLRSDYGVVLLPDGRLLIAGGGVPGMPNAWPVVATALLYDPLTGSYVQTGTMHARRMGQTMILLPNGKVLAAGGATSFDWSTIGSGPAGTTRVTNTAEVYNPETGIWSPTGSMP